MVEFLKEEWDRPSRSDWYLMAIECAIKRQWSKNPRSIELAHSKLKFHDKEADEDLVKIEENEIAMAAADSKERWRNRMGLGPDGKPRKKKQRGPERNGK